MPMRNKINKVIEDLGISAYRFAQQTQISLNNVYLLKNNPSQFPSGEVFDKILKAFPQLTLYDIVERYEEEAESN